MIDGVKGKTKRVGKHNFEVRTDGFGTMTDEEVIEYKNVRARYDPERTRQMLEDIKKRLLVLEGVNASPE